MTEVAKLTERVDNLIERVVDLRADGKDTRDKLDDVKLSIASFKGAIKVFGGIYALALVLMSAFLAWFLRPPAAAPTQTTPAATPQK